MRSQPNTPPDVKRRDDLDLITQTRRYKVITPLFGGGVTPGEADPVTVVRATEVRGHLRFWWRATRGGQFNGSLAAMKRREEEIWGSSGETNKPGPSPVRINLVLLQPGKPFQAVDKDGRPVKNIGNPNSIDSYAAFPLRDKQDAQLIEDVEFELTISLCRQVNEDNIEGDVAAALWAWETFGGIGARTRRGFGAIQCSHVNGSEVIPPTPSQVLNDIQDGLSQHLHSGIWPKQVPHLSGNPTKYKITGHASPIAVWRNLIGKLREFRQSRVGYHRSKWPEPDEIRRRTGSYKAVHAPVHPVRKFPRAAFGLPIIFEFKRQDVPPEPRRTTLQGANHERLASPLILRPFACTGPNRAVGLAIILDAEIRPPGGWLLKDAPNKPADPPIDAELKKHEANAIEPLKKVGGETDVLLAFLQTLNP